MVVLLDRVLISQQISQKEQLLSIIEALKIGKVERWSWPSDFERALMDSFCK